MKSLSLLVFLLLAICCKDNSQSNLEKIVLSPATVSELVLGDSIQFAAGYFDKTGQSQVAVPSWESSNPGIVTMRTTGVAIPKAVGTASIKATFKGIQSPSVILNVTKSSNKVYSVSISVAKTTLSLNETITFSALALNFDGVPIAGKSASWQTEDADIILINGNGFASAVGQGMTEITAVIENVKSAPKKMIVAL